MRIAAREQVLDRDTWRARAEAHAARVDAHLRPHLTRRAEGSTLNADQDSKVSSVYIALDSLSGLRASVRAGTINWFDILNGYSDFIAYEFGFQSSLTDQESGEVARKGVVVVELGRARELLSQEDALVLGAHRARLDLTPGLTGPWQVLGRNHIPFDEMVRIDYMYVADWTLWGDAKLLLRTLAVVVQRHGA